VALNVMIRHRFATTYRVSSLADTSQSVPSSHISSGTESTFPQKHKLKHHKPIHKQSQLILDSIFLTRTKGHSSSRPSHLTPLECS
jgi:hypothetical protein